MYNVFIALAVGVATTVLFGLIVGGNGLEVVYYGVVPGVIAAITVFVLLARRILKRVELIVADAQADFQNQKIDRGVEKLKGAYGLAKWQIFLRSQIDGQIGSIYFMSKRFNDAEPYLKRGFRRSWVPRAMLGTLYYKRKKYDQMKEVFEDAVAVNKKQPLLWNLYAYCLWKINDRDGAIKVLTRALKVQSLENDEKTKNNLKALQNKRKMKMRGWNLSWYQFHLDKPPAQRIQAGQQFRRR